jgi:GNAT superfamily N-acetyltransferase
MNEVPGHGHTAQASSATGSVISPAGALLAQRPSQVYHAEELALVDWDEGQKAAFVQMQFIAQHHYYHVHYADAAFQVIECDGMPAGRLYVARGSTEMRIVDIALLPSYRGVGSWLLEESLAEAARTGKRVSIHVERFNPARRLYERLGFRRIADQGAYLLMEWAPAAPPPTIT